MVIVNLVVIPEKTPREKTGAVRERLTLAKSSQTEALAVWRSAENRLSLCDQCMNAWD